MNHQMIKQHNDYVDFLSDSRIWSRFVNEVGFTVSDIVIADPFKAGTTFTQRVIDQILTNGEESKESLSDKSPWLDSSWGDYDGMLKTLAEQKKTGHRRVIKSHLPANYVPIDPSVKYVFVGRNGKDLVCSFHNYLYNFNAETVAKINTLYAAFSGTQEKMLIPQTSNEFFDLFLATSGVGLCDVLDVTKTWWQYKDQPNVLLVHYSKMINDFENEIKRIAQFIDVDVANLNLEKIKANCSFAFMKDNADKFIPFNGKHMTDAKAFFQAGPERDSKKTINAEQIQKFDQLALEKMGAECAKWLETGEF
jgi:aryl sulfotransferase